MAWSRAQVAGTDIGDWPEMDEEERKAVEDDVRGAAFQVIRMKGVTCYAIGLALAKITEAVLKTPAPSSRSRRTCRGNTASTALTWESPQ